MDESRETNVINSNLNMKTQWVHFIGFIYVAGSYWKLKEETSFLLLFWCAFYYEYEYYA